MIDFKKFAQYSRPGPRYTSYPTAPEFNESFDLDRYKSHIERSNASGREVSLYFHLPFCRSACYFCGCNVVYTSKEDVKSRYIGYLEREMSILARWLDTGRTVRQLHFGGGTPTFYHADQLAEIIRLIRKQFPNIAPDAEFGVEIDPRFFNADQMKALKAGGVNRVSFGVQDFDPKVQEATHRLQPFDLTKSAVEIARAHGIESVNVDLIYGLPFQSLETFKETLRLTLALNPDRIALFNYAHVPWMKKTMRKIDETTLPEPEEKLLIMQTAIEMFAQAGYKMIGMDHFAKPEDELCRALDAGKLHRNFQGYTTHGDTDLFGLGVTSIGEGADFYAQSFRDLEPYEAAIDADRLPLMRGFSLSDDDRLRKHVIMQLMSNFTLDFAEVEKKFSIDFKNYFAQELEALKPFEAEALLTVGDKGITIGETGRLLVRNLVMPFDAYLKRVPEEQRRFSKTV